MEDAVADVDNSKSTFKQAQKPSQCFHIIREPKKKVQNDHPYHRACRERWKWRMKVMSWGEAQKVQQRKLTENWSTISRFYIDMGSSWEKNLNRYWMHTNLEQSMQLIIDLTSEAYCQQRTFGGNCKSDTRVGDEAVEPNIPRTQTELRMQKNLGLQNTEQRFINKTLQDD
ncbi:MAG: hypothetical protein EZS28_028255 [Streblomastix strix]|uniref:Uncharacterized protein n=1 Tax=Streblomastix strix TaxID=222440 RepID=A0A5J4V0J0_9EUKA|nr:MAG: hypothetical protein EZS28_028255 [Streblomastix strix]